MNIKAFNINSDINEKEFYPENYVLDNTLDKEVLNFFNTQKNDENIFPKKTLIQENINNTNTKLPLNNHMEEEISNNEEDEEEDDSSELIYSSFPDNTTKAKNEIYEKMNINENIIKAIIEEYSKIKEKFINSINNSHINDCIQSDKDKFIFRAKEFNSYDITPSDEFIKLNILPYKSNEYLIKNINKCLKVLKSLSKKNQKEINKLSQWIYTFLLFLEMPLSPDNCADLYSMNKYIYNNFIKSSELKIIFVVICEIFKQVLIL